VIAPSLLMVWAQVVRVPDLTADLQWRDVGGILYETLGANPLVVDAAQNRPSAFDDLPANLGLLGDMDVAVLSGVGSVAAIHLWSPLRRQVEVVASTPVTIGFRILDYPYWSVSTGAPEGIGVGGAAGIVACRLPPGRHLVDVEWSGNPLAPIGQIIAALTVAALVLGRRRRGGVVP